LLGDTYYLDDTNSFGDKFYFDGILGCYNYFFYCN